MPDRPNSSIRLLLARHGLTDWNIERRYQGQTDVPLNETGRRQARALARRLAGEEIDAIYASDLRRAWETAQYIAGRHTCPLQPDPRLREMCFGVWEGLTYDEISRMYPEALAAWVASPDSPPPGGEPLGQVVQRVDEMLAALRKTHRRQTVVLVAHGGLLQVLLCTALEFPPLARWKFRLDTASLSELYLYDDGAILTSLNDRHHLLDMGRSKAAPERDADPSTG